MPPRNPADPAAPKVIGESDSNQRSHMVWIWHLLYILYSLEVGFILLFLPWMGLWENNYLLYRFPHLRPLVANPFLKGAIFGLGLVNILIGAQEIVHFRKNSRNKSPK